MRSAIRAIFVAMLGLAPSTGPALAQGAGESVPAMTAPAVAAATPFRLLMVERAGCVYCHMWNSDLGPIYPKTREGRLAPLEHVQLSDMPPEDATIGAKVIYTPTFILLKDNTEVARLEGYASEDFFWGLLGQALRDNGADLFPPGQ